jgi:hypothetical protein
MTDLPLRDIHLPESISWWPLADGWWCLFGLVLVCAFVVIRKCTQNTLAKETMRELAAIQQAFEVSDNGAVCLAQVSVLLRRVAISRDASVAGLTGQAWLENLGSSFSDCQILLSGPYQPHVPKEEVSELLQRVHKWVKSL